MKVRAWEFADSVSHRLLDSYIDAKRPGWGRLQLWQWYLCNAYERAAGWIE